MYFLQPFYVFYKLVIADFVKLGKKRWDKHGKRLFTVYSN